MQLQRWVSWGALLGGLLSSGCPEDDADETGTKRDSGVDAPVDLRAVDSPADAPQDGPMCSIGLKPFYKDPGCGGGAVAVCAASDDGCFGEEICLCDGRTSRKCIWSEAPFRHVGACGSNDGSQDGPGPLDASLSCNCGPGRTCVSNAVHATWCSVCQCRPDGFPTCQAIACPWPDSGEPQALSCEAAPGDCQGDCIYDQGCEAPRAFCSPTKCSNTFGQSAYCGCDGVTFISDCPRKSYRHVGACR